MTSNFNSSDLLAIINGNLDLLVLKHPDDRQNVAVIRKALEQLVGSGTKTSKSSGRSKPVSQESNPDDDSLGDKIAALAGSLFSSYYTEPVTIATMLPLMRKNIIGLPEGDHAAKVSITRALSTRKDKFTSFAGDKERDPMRWYAKK